MKLRPMPQFRPTLLIPSFNTGPILRQTVEEALTCGVPARVVIDGSTDGSASTLWDLENEGRISVTRLNQNSGKGAAVEAGLRQARADGFTHALTMDADGQHPAEAVPGFLEIGRHHPEAAVFGSPVFGHCAPPLRVHGRKISNFWANLETLGWGIDDSLFGMRLYPIQPLLDVLEETPFARRFDFDPEVAVRLAWKGVPIINVPTRVRYLTDAEGGISQFRYLRDNALLTAMHARLFLGFLARAPWLALRGENPLLHLSPPT